MTGRMPVALTAGRSQMWSLLNASSEGKGQSDPGLLIMPLKPWTQYAIMVKTQLAASDDHPRPRGQKQDHLRPHQCHQ